MSCEKILNRMSINTVSTDQIKTRDLHRILIKRMCLNEATKKLLKKDKVLL